MAKKRLKLKIPTKETPKQPSARASKVRDILNKYYGTQTVSVLSDHDKTPAVAIDFPVFDWGLLGIGGIPRGYMVEISGADKSGKSTLLAHAIAGVQRRDMVPIVVDANGTMTRDIARMQRIGVDISNCVVVPIVTADEALQGTREAIRKLQNENIQLAFFWDDSGITPAQAEITPKRDQKTKQDKIKVGAKSTVLWNFCRTLAGECYRTKSIMVVVNHHIANIQTGFGSQFAPKKVTSGGGAFRYTASIRISLSKGKAIKQNGRKVGRYVYAVTDDNCFFPPLQRRTFVLNFRNGYDADLSLLDAAIEEGLVTKTRGAYKIPALKKVKPFRETRLKKSVRDYLVKKLYPWSVDPNAYEDAIEEFDDDTDDEKFLGSYGI